MNSMRMIMSNNKMEKNHGLNELKIKLKSKSKEQKKNYQKNKTYLNIFNIEIV